MLYRVLADTVVIVHLLWIVFLVLGGLWGVRNRAVRAVHLAGLGFALLMQARGWYCPLTHLEARLRSGYGPAPAYPGSFITHYAEKIVYMEVSHGLIFALTVLIGALNAWLYLRRARRRAPDADS